MKLLVDRLTATPVREDFEASASWWQDQVVRNRDVDYEVESPFLFAVAGYMLSEDVFLEGELRGAIKIECGRCLRRYRHALAETFRLVLEPARGRQPVDPQGIRALARDGLALGDELDVGWYQGSEIVLDRFFAELISLALPLQPLCSEECKGLCPRCGADRNRVDCGCEEQKPPSPFAALAALRDDGSGGNP